MIILKIKNNAGPGNQMFMYARAYSLAKKYGHKILIISEISGFSVRQNILQNLKLDKKYIAGFIRLDWTKNPLIFRIMRKLIFDVILKFPFIHQITQKNQESRIYMDTEILESGKIYFIDGYWECHAYFDDVRNELIEQFVPNYDLDKTVKDFFEQIDANSVAVHVRKGDFQHFNRLINDDYYSRAANLMKMRHKSAKFYILTEDDDIAEKWEKEYQAERIFFHTKTRYLDEWYTMTKCKYHIIANSTYSWWSSFLSNNFEKEVIVPSLEEYLSAEKNNTDEMYGNYYFNKAGETIEC